MTEPVDLDAAKLHLRVDDNSQDAAITRSITAAREWVEGYTGLKLVPTEITQHFDSFALLRMKGWPVAPDAAIAISYLDSDGVAQVIASYRLLAADRPALVLPGLGQSWPSIYSAAGAVTLTYDAGYATPQEVPEVLKQAMLIIIASLFVSREFGLSEDSERAAARLCRQFKRRVL